MTANRDNLADPPPSQPAGPRWYAVQTKPRQEAVAEQNLLNQDYRVYLPRLRVQKRRRNRWQTVVEPLFPGYLFLRADLHRENIAPVRSSFGVRAMVRFGHEYKPLPDEIVEFFRQQEAAREQEEQQPTELFNPGDKVAIQSGPFAGLEAVYQMSKAEDRALLLIHILGGQKSIAVAVDDIAPER